MGGGGRGGEAHRDEDKDLRELHDRRDGRRGSGEESLDAEVGADHLFGVECLSLGWLCLVALTRGGVRRDEGEPTPLTVSAAKAAKVRSIFFGGSPWR
jgi:hypothetical protein